jgi:hypothetical protein
MLAASDIVVLLIRVNVRDLKYRLNLLVSFPLYVIDGGVSSRLLLIRIGIFITI